MKILSAARPLVALAALALGLISPKPGLAQADAVTASPFNVTTPEGGVVHVFPTTAELNRIMAVSPRVTGALVYHGGPVMGPTATTFYIIYWAPPKLQSGAPTSIPASYMSVLNSMVSNYSAHGIDNNNTQYYSVSGTVTTYVKNAGSLGGTYTDTTAYPASGCTDTYTPGGCLSDAQLQAEITSVMKLKGWTGGLNKMFLLFTSSGEGSCSSASSCAYSNYCAYHSVYGTVASPIIYGNEPYGNTTYCQVPGTPSPHNNPLADAAATGASHEMTEAITDPELNAWYTTSGSEIGDLCAYQYGTNGWDSAKANQMWNGAFFELQLEYDNHTASCVAVGP
jgi:hypothetical protein